ncbi:MAG: NAD(P)-dependent oxidoreductase [Rhodospirillales bacterium CG15_BIG_FIL_POST_REV_8_21_14_020_66_15]|nr:MAG: NAD(P)-dependent oxidoreductase [Rhodospirillales bacterium CG15_BIG_FIL_POST_REV_8_21_14_020_66_15]
MTLPPVGFIGLGTMGRGMALNLVKAAEAVYVFDPAPEAMKLLTDAGAIACASPAEVTEKTATIVLCVPDAPQVRDVIFGPGGNGPKGIVEAGRGGITVLDATTMVRDKAIAIHEEAAEKGVAYWDCPISGLPRRAADGTLTIMFGGTKEAYEAALPVLSACGRDILHCGPAGAGQAMKGLNNVIYDINIAAFCELLPLAVKAGMEVGVLEKLVLTGSSRSFASEHFVPKILGGDFTGDFPMQAAFKDIVNVRQMAAEVGGETPLADAMTAIYEKALAAGFGDGPKSSIVKLYEAALGVEFRRPDKE